MKAARKASAADGWLAPVRRFWSAFVDALERHLDRMDPSTRRGPNRQPEKGETK